MDQHSENNHVQVKEVPQPAAAGYRNAFVLMRIPFSLYLMPIYWFALSTLSGYPVWRAVVVFIILHLLVYPASNGYNSYCDRDEDSIGGLKRPPKVTRELFYLVLLFDLLSVGAALLLSPVFALMVAVYLLVSKAYSSESIRLKRYPLLSTLVVTFFQGAFTYATVQVGLGLRVAQVLETPNAWFALVSTLLLCGSYPLTQIYQHQEDARRGDKTLSLLLGINGTFLFAGSSLLLGASALLWLYYSTGELLNIAIFLASTAPVVFFFTRWVLRAQTDRQVVNFENTMRMNKISSLSISLAFMAMIAARLLL